MKCIKNTETGKIVRVMDSEAHMRVGFGWQFVSKSEWKADRKTNVVEVSDDTTEKVEKKNKKSKKQLV